MGYRIRIWDEDDNEYTGTTVYSTFREALHRMNEDMEEDTYIDGKVIVCSEVISEDE